MVAVPAGDDQGVRYGGRGEVRVRDETQSAGRPYRAAVEGGGAYVVARRRVTDGVRRPVEHLQGAGDIEALHALEEDDEYGSLRHDVDSSAADGWPQ